MANTGGEVDTDPGFFPFCHTEPLRPLQQRLLPVYRFHVERNPAFRHIGGIDDKPSFRSIRFRDEMIGITRMH